MKIDRTYFCSAADCDAHQTTAAETPPAGWITVTEHLGATRTEEAFCGWDCVMKFAATFPPPEIIHVGGDDADPLWGEAHQ